MPPDNAVGEPKIRAFAGSLGAAKANKGVLVTTSRFARSAHDFAVRTPSKILLIDGDMLAGLMIRYGVGVRTERTILAKERNEAFFLDEWARTHSARSEAYSGGKCAGISYYSPTACRSSSRAPAVPS